MQKPNQADFDGNPDGYQEAVNQWNAFQAEQAEQANTNSQPSWLLWALGGLLLLLMFFGYMWYSNSQAANAAITEKQEIQDDLIEERAKKQAPAPVLVAPVWEKGDEDSDGLPNGFEETIGTDPYSKDWDGDGELDGEEVGNVTELTDKDGDGYLDLPDEDNDGIPDVFESSKADADSDGSVDQRDPCNKDFHNKCARVKVCCNGTQTVEYINKVGHPSQARANSGSHSNSHSGSYATTCQCGSCRITITCDGRSTCGKCSYKERRSREYTPPPPPPIVKKKKSNKVDPNSPCSSLVKDGKKPPKGYKSWCDFYQDHYPDLIVTNDGINCQDICGNTHHDSVKGDLVKTSSSRMASRQTDDDDF